MLPQGNCEKHFSITALLQAFPVNMKVVHLSSSPRLQASPRCEAYWTQITA